MPYPAPPRTRDRDGLAEADEELGDLHTRALRHEVTRLVQHVIETSRASTKNGDASREKG